MDYLEARILLDAAPPPTFVTASFTYIGVTTPSESTAQPLPATLPIRDALVKIYDTSNGSAHLLGSGYTRNDGSLAPIDVSANLQASDTGIYFVVSAQSSTNSNSGGYAVTMPKDPNGWGAQATAEKPEDDSKTPYAFKTAAVPATVNAIPIGGTIDAGAIPLHFNPALPNIDEAFSIFDSLTTASDYAADDLLSAGALQGKGVDAAL